MWCLGVLRFNECIGQDVEQPRPACERDGARAREDGTPFVDSSANVCYLTAE